MLGPCVIGDIPEAVAEQLARLELAGGALFLGRDWIAPKSLLSRDGRLDRHAPGWARLAQGEVWPFSSFSSDRWYWLTFRGNRLGVVTRRVSLTGYRDCRGPAGGRRKRPRRGAGIDRRLRAGEPEGAPRKETAC